MGSHDKLAKGAGEDVAPAMDGFYFNTIYNKQVICFVFSFIPLETAGVCWRIQVLCLYQG